MTRLTMEANFQYVPVAPEVVPLIASLVAPAPSHDHTPARTLPRFIDSCAGEGEAAAAMAKAWNIGRDQLYLNELADGRKARCSRFTDHVLGADAIRGLQISRHAFQVAWTNPPFGQQPKAQGGGRLEPLFFKRIVEEGGWLQPGAIHLMLAPQDVWLSNLGTLNHLARCYDRVTMVTLPAAYRCYRELLVVGVVRAGWRSGAELKEHARLIAEKLTGELPELTYQATPSYAIPSPLKQQRQFIWRDANAATPEQARDDVLAQGGAWASRSYRTRLEAARQDRRRIRPLFPLGKVAAALRVAEGDINHQVVTIAGRQARIKGSTRRTTKTWQEERVTNEGTTVIETHRMELREPVVVTLDTERATITRYTGDTGIAALMDTPDAAQSLLDAVAKSAPPVYDMQLPADVAAVLDTIVSVTGRALPGYAPGFIPMQRHIIAAIATAFRLPDPHTGKRRTVIGLSADMGTGKSSLAAGSAEVIRQLLPLPTNGPGRAFTALVVAPNHLVGERSQIVAHEAARPEQHDRSPLPHPIAHPLPHPLPQWIAEWRDLLPHWYTTILETPAQVTAFYRGASADPVTPRVGFIAFSKFSLGSGWEIAVTRHRPALPVPSVSAGQPGAAGVAGVAGAPGATPDPQRLAWRASFYQRLADEDQREWEELKQREQARKQQNAQRVARATATAHGTGTGHMPQAFGPGVSERTIRRDRLFRCGTAHREALNIRERGEQPPPLWHFDGLFCPDCGRRVRSKDGFPHTPETLRKAGMIACPFCGGRLGQLDRKQDNVGDRELPIFADPTYRNDHATSRSNGVPRRVIPWGKRPTSNPRIALGDFLVTRGYARHTDFVITDEAHHMKGFASARGRIWGRLIAHAQRSVSLTGSPYGGKASTAYWLLQRMANPLVRSMFAWKEEREFVERLGIIDTITSQVVETDAQAFSGKRNAATVRVEERNGITAELAAIMQSQFLFILLRQMGFNLPNYREGVVCLDLPAGIAQAYARLVQHGKAIVKQPGGKDALSSYLQSTLTYPMAPWKPVTVRSKQTGAQFAPPALPPETIMPHHRWLAQHAATQARAGRGMLVFAEHTNKLDVLADLQTKIQSLALAEHGTPVKVAILRSTTVKPGARGAWFAAREQDGTQLVLCHPGLVETGMNLIEWPEIVFAEPTYSLYRAMQARKRALRPTQTRDCNVTWLSYTETMIEQALDIIGSKATAATLLNGDDLSSGLLQIDPGMSLLQELAKRVMRDDDVTGQNGGMSSHEAIAARMATAGTALKQAMEIGARDLVGIATDVDLQHLLPKPVVTVPPSAQAEQTQPLTVTNGAPAVTSECDAPFMTWNEVLVRRKKGQRTSTAPNDDDQQQSVTVQFTFL